MPNATQHQRMTKELPLPLGEGRGEGTLAVDQPLKKTGGVEPHRTGGDDAACGSADLRR